MVNYSKILVPIDFSDFSKSALDYAVDFARFHNSEIIVIFVIEPVSYPPDLSIGQNLYPAFSVEVSADIEKKLGGLFENAVEDFSNFRTVLKHGKPFVEIIETAKIEDVDLIIISTHGRTGMEHILFGSTAEKVVRKSPCPVMVLRDPLKGFEYKKHFEKED